MPTGPYPASCCLALDLASRATPDRLTDIESWHEHIPFAFALIGLMRPRVLVELGTHKGDSFCAFCQAVVESGSDTRCFAVDSWRGDPQAGVYGQEILDELQRYAQPRYGGFATLLPLLFDDALQNFADGSIDLLHIDGLHTEEAVRHDFDTWLPKMSSRGVVLFHDTTVEKDGFGVWKVWKELSGTYPGFEFRHGNGLGVLLVGQTPPAELLAWCDAKTHALLETVLHKLGERLRINRHLELHKSVNAQLWARTHQAEASLDETVGELARAQESLRETRNRLVLAERRAVSAEAELAKLLASRTWRATAPLRLALEFFRRSR